MEPLSGARSTQSTTRIWRAMIISTRSQKKRGRKQGNETRTREERETPMPHVAHTRVKRSRGAGGVVVTKTNQVKGHKKRRGSGQMKQLATIGVASHECDSQLRGASHAREETRVKQQSMAARRNKQQATTP